jgi:Ca-activated chloride channel family protein
MMEAFHFLRPFWLMTIPVIVLIWWAIRRRDAMHQSASGIIADHLREALTVNADGRLGFRPVDMGAAALLLLALAAAGPTWNKIPSPWFAETAPLVVAIEVSDSMRSNDLLPTRLDRARFKLLDLIEKRTGSRTALIAYSGSAHIVMPPTRDADVIKPFLESLDPAIMPAPGTDAAAVLPLARELFADEAAIGTLLFVNDGFDPLDIAPLAEFAANPGSPSLAALVVGTDAGGVALMPDGSPVMSPGGGRLDTTIDPALLRRVGDEAGISIIRSATGEADVMQLMRTIESNLRQADDPDSYWLDRAWWLLLPALLLVLLQFRRGWTMQW